jgi:hypothetical protein
MTVFLFSWRFYFSHERIGYYWRTQVPTMLKWKERREKEKEKKTVQKKTLFIKHTTMQNSDQKMVCTKGRQVSNKQTRCQKLSNFNNTQEPRL